MADGLDYYRYQEYVRRATGDLGVVRVQSFEEARVRWGVRNLSPSEFRRLTSTAVQGGELHERWRERLELGYDREKSAVEDDIEGLFARVPASTSASRHARNGPGPRSCWMARASFLPKRGGNGVGRP